MSPEIQLRREHSGLQEVVVEGGCMALHDIKIMAELPDVPKRMSVFTVRAASLDERRNAVDILRNELELGELHTVDVMDSLHFVSKNGEIQYYRPSGALWARNVAADELYEDEMRPWKTEAVEEKDGNIALVLPKSTEEELTREARSLFEKAGLLGEHAYFLDISLEQIVNLDEKGKEIERFPGEAIVRFLYKLDNVNVNGGGAKSYAYYNPGDKGGLVGIFHSWREIVDTCSVQTIKIKEVINTVIAEDKEVRLYHERGYTVELTEMELVYYSLPPFMYQEYVFPALRVIGSVFPGTSENEKRQGFEFARYFHVVSAEEYAKAGLYADYLITL